MQPLSQAVLLEAFPPHERGKAMGFWRLGIVSAPILGPVLGGWLTDTYSWRWIFYINIPVGLASLVMTKLFVFDPPYLKRESERIDYWGIGFLAVGIGALQLILDLGQREDWFESNFIVSASVLSLTMLVVFIIHELQTEHPVVDLRIFRERTYSTGVFLMTTLGFVLYGSLVLLPLMLQTLLGYPSIQAGMAMAPRGMGSFLGMPAIGMLVGRVDPRKLVVGGLVLGSATPSLESLHRVAAGAVRRFGLPRRIDDRPLPPVELVDLRTAPRVPEAGAVPWSEALDGAVRDALELGQQVILLLNRRGFASFLQCPSCGDVPECPRCAIALTVHATPAALRCHYCGHEEPVPTTCRRCGKETQRMRGLGTQQLEHFVGLRFPAARIARMDLDTTSSKWSHHRILERVGRRAVDILLGTQMIAKGLDFPHVTVVGVVDADTGLHFPDFRAAERTFQLVAQVAGRAGRGPAGGRVVVQTRAPDHHALRAAAAHDVTAFAAAELPLRTSPHPSYPPHVGLVRFVALGTTEAAAAARAGRVAEWLRRASAERTAR